LSSKLKNNESYLDPRALPISQESMDSMMRSDASWCYQFDLLARRNFLNLMRLPQTSYVKLIVTLLTAAFCIILFYDVGQDKAGV